MNIKGKAAIITGAGSGIGQAIAIELAERGVGAVGLVDRSDGVINVARLINDRMDRPVAEAMIGDVTDTAFRQKVFDLMCSKYGAPAVCVPAAGITRDSLAVKMDKQTGRATIYPIENFRLVMEVNLVAPVYWAIEMMARIAEERLQQGQGALGRRRGNSGNRHFHRLDLVVGHPRPGFLFVNQGSSRGSRCHIVQGGRLPRGPLSPSIHPGFTDTPMVRALGQEYIEKNILPYTQLKRLIDPSEIADAIYFMICNSAVSGELWADAGWHPSA